MGASFLAGKASRTADGKFNINTGTLKAFLVPVPTTEEQHRIKDILAQVDKKSIVQSTQLKDSQDLFRTLLHQLMTAEIRVNNVDLKELGLDSEK
jgi:type I restriction enzyme S subunit